MPSTKVSAGVLAGALSIVIVWALGQFAHLTLPAEVGSALTAIITFGTSYVVPEPKVT